jgi:receptor expression-enhancing protein 5/6
MDKLKEKLADLEKDLDDIPFMRMLGEKTGLKPSYIAGGGLLIVFLFVIIGFMGQLLTDCVGVLYPAYKSLKSLETRGDDDDRQWLTYWAVYSLFIIFDTYSGFILSYVPHYFLFKLIFVIWLMAPTTRGACLLHKKVLRDFFLKYKNIIQDKINGGADLANKAAKNV